MVRLAATNAFVRVVEARTWGNGASSRGYVMHDGSGRERIHSADLEIHEDSAALRRHHDGQVLNGPLLLVIDQSVDAHERLPRRHLEQSGL